MKKIYFPLLLAFLSNSLFAQSITVNGACISGPVVLNKIADANGKVAFEGTGTVLATPNTVIDILWLPAPDNLWALSFDGQPYFSNACTINNPPGTANTSCPWIPVTGMGCTGGTALSITGDVVLPVSLIDFAVYKKGNQAILKWETLLEINNKGFEIQKSNDGINWVNIGFVNGHGNSSVEINYQFTDANPYAGRNEYRLCQVDLDGNQTFSTIENINFRDNSYYTISNNPGRGIYQISMLAGAEKLDMAVFDISGKMIYRKITNAGNQTLDVSNAAAGVYWLRMKQGSNLFTEKLIKF